MGSIDRDCAADCGFCRQILAEKHAFDPDCSQGEGLLSPVRYDYKCRSAKLEDVR
jgi:hypothetical protein